MATITLTLSTKKDKYTNKSQVLMYFVGGAGYVYRAKTGIYVKSSYWKNGKIIVPRIAGAEQRLCVSIQGQLDKLCSAIIESFTNTPRSEINKEWLLRVIYNFHYPEKVNLSNNIKLNFFEEYDKFVCSKKVSLRRIDKFNVLKRMLQRFELWSDIKLDINTISSDILRSFEKYLYNEHTILSKRPDIIFSIPQSRVPVRKGKNTIIEIFRVLRTFFNWLNNEEITLNNPFKNFSAGIEHYGTPYYITIDERNRIMNCNLSRHPKLAIQRDIFVFQCLIGCRVGDLLKLTKYNIINGAVEYIPRKTKEGRPITVRVPLSDTAQLIVNRYYNTKGSMLLPFIAEQKYNKAIKIIFRASRINRIVTVINPTTGEPEHRKLCDIASSHLARRTFIGNLYKQVKDPNLVGALSGHKEGSRAFARYREIDEDMKRDLIKLLD